MTVAIPSDFSLTHDEIVVLTAAMDILRGKYDVAGPTNEVELSAFMGALEIGRALTAAGEKPDFPTSVQRMAARHMLDADGRGRI